MGGKASEWLFIDPDHRDRFGHEGATVIPGSGRDWVHLHRKGRQGAGSNPHAAALAEVSEDAAVRELSLWNYLEAVSEFVAGRHGTHRFLRDGVLRASRTARVS